jgi:hypothetical protein
LENEDTIFFDLRHSVVLQHIYKDITHYGYFTGKKQPITLSSIRAHHTFTFNRLRQWFPNGVSRHAGVSRGTTRGVAKLKNIYLN